MIARLRAPGAAALLALLAASALPSRAAGTPLPVVLATRGGRLTAAVDLGPLLPAGLPDQMGNGLRNVVAVFVGVVPVGADAPTAAFARVVEVLYDVWEETWLVTVRDPQSPAGRRQVLRSAAELRQLLAHVADGDLGPASALPTGRFTVDVRIDVNPISPELLARTRQYLAGASGPGRGSRSVLGTVAGFLLREPGDDGEVLLFRSLALTPGAVGTP